MLIGIIGAMQVEIEGLKGKLSNRRTEAISGIEFHSGSLEGCDVVLAVSGVGKVNSAMCAQTMILKYAPSLIINTGVAGSLAKGIKIGDVVIADAVVQHDVDTSALGDPVGFVSGVNRIEFPCSAQFAQMLAQAARNQESTGVHRGIIATGDRFIASESDSKVIAERFGAVANEMEGGSIGQVCFINNVEFCVVRAISDGDDNDSHLDYLQFVEMAAQKSISIMLRFLSAVKAA